MGTIQVFNEIVAQYNVVLGPFTNRGLMLARWLFITLAGIQIVWSAILWILNKDDPHSIIISFAKKIMVIAFFWAVLLNYHSWIPAIFNSFYKAGLIVSGAKASSPTAIVERGLELWTVIMAKSSTLGPIKNIVAGLTALFAGSCILFILCRIACEMVLILIGGQLILFGGTIMLGFAGSSWTMKYAERYFNTAVNLGVKMMFIILVVGTGESLSAKWVTLIEDANLKNLQNAYLSVVAASFVYYYIALRVPDMAASLLTGSFSIGFGHNDASITSVIAGTAATAGVGYTALNSGSSMISKGAGIGAAVLSAGHASSSNSEAAGKTGLNKAGSTIAGTIRTLGGAIMSRAGEKMKEAVSNTSGGRLADKIKALNPNDKK
ncbi:MAG: P-type conjugative transfer protein TrbL [Candidatus Omnitrophica bacterium]|nr:P-type conjugative transfer protein TrbL [Candidatus Omnitrophota bacterium]